MEYIVVKQTTKAAVIIMLWISQ